MMQIFMISFQLFLSKLEYHKTVLTYRVVTPHFRNLRSKRIMWVMIEVIKLSKIFKSLNTRNTENEHIFIEFCIQVAT